MCNKILVKIKSPFDTFNLFEKNAKMTSFNRKEVNSLVTLRFGVSTLITLFKSYQNMSKNCGYEVVICLLQSKKNKGKQRYE